MSRKRGKKKKRLNRLVVKFFTILFSILFVYFIAFGGYIAYTYLNADDNDNYFENPNIISNVIAPKIPEHTNILLTGVDADETRTDTIMVACYNSASKQISLISIPRDTLVKVSDESYSTMKEHSSAISTKEMKINAVHAYAGKEKGMEVLKSEVENLLGIELNYYAKVNCEAFRYLVDSIGGVDFNVEQRLYYSDPTQDLYIDLYPGLQHLDGDQAEQLVRFRKGYAQQDLHRVEVQQQFLKELLKQALQKDTILSNPTAYVNTIIKYVDTDFTLTDTVKYIKALSDFNAANMTGYTLPGNPQSINGASYYICDEEETKKLVDDVFYKKYVAPEDIVLEDSIDKEIQVLNGGYKSGLAGDCQDHLNQKGFNVSDIGDYSGEKQEKTRIYVSKDGQGQDLVEYFEDAEIIVDSDETTDYDIVIVLGTNQDFWSE